MGAKWKNACGDMGQRQSTILAITQGDTFKETQSVFLYNLTFLNLNKVEIYKPAEFLRINRLYYKSVYFTRV